MLENVCFGKNDDDDDEVASFSTTAIKQPWATNRCVRMLCFCATDQPLTGFAVLVLDMGFAEDRVDWALYATGNKGLQPTLDHLEANQDHSVPTDYKNAPKQRTTDHDVSTRSHCRLEERSTGSHTLLLPV